MTLPVRPLRSKIANRTRSGEAPTVDRAAKPAPPPGSCGLWLTDTTSPTYRLRKCFHGCLSVLGAFCGLGCGAANHGCSRFSGGSLLGREVSALQQQDPIRWPGSEPPRKAAAAMIVCPTALSPKTDKHAVSTYTSHKSTASASDFSGSRTGMNSCAMYP